MSTNDEVNDPSYINQPSWVGFYKGGNPYNFSETHLTGIDINKAFAEGLNMQNSVLRNINFEEGDFSRANFNYSKFFNCKFNKTI